jgi:virginiamycin B lyase
MRVVLDHMRRIARLRRYGRSLALAVVLLGLLPVAAHAFAVQMLAPRLFDGEAPGAGVAFAADGNAWSTTDEGRIARITPGGRVTEFGHGITHGGASGRLVASGGALWFAETPTAGGEVWIGRITTTGAVSEFPSGMPQVLWIVRGSDGAIWYVGCTLAGSCPGHQEIARMDATGNVQIFPVTVGYISQLAAAADGQLWFPIGASGAVGPLPAEIGRISSTGKITLLPLPRGVNANRPLVPGPGGGVWFASSSIGPAPAYGTSFRLGFITDAGRVVMMPTVRHALAVDPVAAGSDGSLWYVVNQTTIAGSPPGAGGLSLRLIDRRGKLLTAVSLSATVGTDGMVTGPDHSLWFAAPLGRIVNANDRRADCLVPQVAGKPLGLVAVGDVNGTAWWTTREAGCVYRTHFLGGRSSTGIVTRQRPRAGKLIPASTPIQLTVASALAHYGRCRAPAGAVAVLYQRGVVLLKRLATRSSPTEYWGCITTLGAVRKLFSDHYVGEDNVSASLFHLAGDYAAFATDYSSHYGYDECGVTAVNLRTGNATNVSTNCPTELAVSRAGTLAWEFHTWSGIVSTPATPATPFAEVLVHAAGATRILDIGQPLDITNLAFVGTTLQWMNNGLIHKATIG